MLKNSAMPSAIPLLRVCFTRPLILACVAVSLTACFGREVYDTPNFGAQVIDCSTGKTISEARVTVCAREAPEQCKTGITDKVGKVFLRQKSQDVSFSGLFPTHFIISNRGRARIEAPRYVAREIEADSSAFHGRTVALSPPGVSCPDQIDVSLATDRIQWADSEYLSGGKLNITGGTLSFIRESSLAPLVHMLPMVHNDLKAGTAEVIFIFMQHGGPPITKKDQEYSFKDWFMLYSGKTWSDKECPVEITGELIFSDSNDLLSPSGEPQKYRKLPVTTSDFVITKASSP